MVTSSHLQVPEPAASREAEALWDQPGLRKALARRGPVSAENWDLLGRVEDSVGLVRNGVIIHVFIPQGWVGGRKHTL